MGFTTPDQSTLEQYRNAAEKSHRDYWAANGGSPNPDIYFPGFEAGWNAACKALSEGQSVPNADDQGKSEDEWEWVHGFKQGAKDAEQAGSN